MQLLAPAASCRDPLGPSLDVYGTFIDIYGQLLEAALRKDCSELHCAVNVSWEQGADSNSSVSP